MNLRSRLCFALVVAGSLLFAGCLETLNVTTTPPGATVVADNGARAITPGAIQLEGRDAPYQITVSKEGYQTETVTYATKSAEKTLAVPLAPLVSVKHFALASAPTGATVALGDRTLGITPLTVDLAFHRADKDKPWEPLPLTFTLADHQTETLALTEGAALPAPVKLTLLRAERTYRLTTKASGAGEPIAAALTLDSAPAGSGPSAEIKRTFIRADKSQPWPEFALRAEITAVYQPRDFRITFDTAPRIDLVLEPISEILVERFFPLVEMTPTGPRLGMSHEKKTGTIDTAEPAADITGLARVTDFARRDLDRTLPLEALNSYAILPQGNFVVISVTTQDAELARTDPAGSFSAHLELRSASEGNNQRTILTNDPGYLDTAPVISPFDGAQPFIIFQSNRGDFAKSDLYRLQLDEHNSPLGGLARITTDARFNFAPTCADTNRVIVYLSLQPNYARALPQLCTVTKDGALPTQFPITATEVSQRDIERVFFTRKNDRTGRLQIFYMQPDGKLVTQAVADPAFSDANCFNPAPAYAKGGRILFVSDRVRGKTERANNNIYVMNADGSGLQRLTSNESDDILPCWSPLENEPDVFYFVSNRGGAYNLWKARLVGSK